MTEWNPGLNDDITLHAAYDSMPGDEAAAIPWYVRLLENPASPVALPGAVDLFGHDCIHIVLGRGVFQQDEAFVIGFTMGASGHLASWQHRLFSLSACCLYRSFYRFSQLDRRVFDLAVGFAIGSGAQPVHNVAWLDLLDWPVGKVRAWLGIDTRSLTDIYQRERALCPGSPAALRLPRCSEREPSDPGTPAGTQGQQRRDG